MQNQYSKRIRILSFHNAHNFGAILQAYGLQQTIKGLGYNDVKFLKYNPEYLKKRYNPFSSFSLSIPDKSIKRIIGWILNYPFFVLSSIRRNRKFSESIKRLLIQTNKNLHNINDLKKESIGILICGSDQIWNTSLTGNFDPIFFGKGNYKQIDYAISYAPSTELSDLTTEKAKKLALQLDNFKYVSVRENPICNILQKYTNKDIKVCIDPTLLCGSKAFNEIASNRLIREKYIIVYAYDPTDELISNAINHIPNKEEYKIHIILLSARGRKNFFNSSIHSEISVEDFLSYMKYASYVITNSFHGLAFSLLFEKNFYVTYFAGKEIRCTSLLENINLLDRFIQNKTTISWEQPNYRIINQNIARLRESSLLFLKNSLNDTL